MWPVRTMLVLCALTDLPTYRLFAQSRPQPLTLAGRLLHVRGADTVPLAGQFVVAHAVSSRRQGAFDSARTDSRGRFRFVVSRPESLMVYLVSSRYAGVGYFSEPFGAAARSGSDSVALTVFDTASAGAPLTIGTRHVVLTSPDASGGGRGLRRVLDVIEVVNGGATTRIGADSLAPVWRMRLPAGVNEVEAGESEFAASALRFEDGAVLLAAPFPPGEKQIAVTYVLPEGARRFAIPVDQPTAQFAVLAEDSLTTPAGGLRRGDPLLLEGRVFQRFVAEGLTAGATPTVTLARGGAGTRRFWWVPVAVVGLALALGAAYATTRRVAPR